MTVFLMKKGFELFFKSEIKVKSLIGKVNKGVWLVKMKGLVILVVIFFVVEVHF